jgi:hypothetical protein
VQTSSLCAKNRTEFISPLRSINSQVDQRGINNVWDVALTCADDSVAHEAQKMLNLLFHNVDLYFEKDGKKKALKLRGLLFRFSLVFLRLIYIAIDCVSRL